MYAIKWYSKHIEHVGMEEFDVKSSYVDIALEKVKANNQAKLKNQELNITPDTLPDPHADLPTNNLSVEELDNIMDYLLKNKDGWSDIAICMLWGISGFLRGHSVRMSTWKDIYLDHSHGVERRGTLASSINWILRKGGNNHKTNLERNRVVGCWRHKEVFHCPIGILAMSFLCKLSDIGGDLSFKRTDLKKDYFWRNLPIVEFSSYNDQYKKIHRVLQFLGITCSKVTHFKRTGIDYGGTAGLDRSQLGSHAKMALNNSRVDNSAMDYYEPEINREVGMCSI
mgnify:FL=1